MTFLVEINKLITNLYINSLGKKQRNIHGKFANIKAYQPGNGFKTQVSIERRLQSLRGSSHQEHLGLLPEHTHTHTHTQKKIQLSEMHTHSCIMQLEIHQAFCETGEGQTQA